MLRAARIRGQYNPAICRGKVGENGTDKRIFAGGAVPRWRRGDGEAWILSMFRETPMWITPRSARQSSRACLRTQAFASVFWRSPITGSAEAFRTFGRPRLGFLVSAGNIDSMVAHYTAAKKRRTDDYYSPGGRAGLRPDRAVIVYTNRIREAYGDVPVILGGLEASLRRFAHYDYWENRVRRSVLVDSRADLLTYGMGEKILLEIARLLDRGVPIRKIRNVRGTVFLIKRDEAAPPDAVWTHEYDVLKTDKRAYANAYGVQYRNQDAIYGRAVLEGYGDRVLVQNPPMPPLEREELDRVYALPYMRTYHPMYEAAGRRARNRGGAFFNYA